MVLGVTLRHWWLGSWHCLKRTSARGRGKLGQAGQAGRAGRGGRAGAGGRCHCEHIVHMAQAALKHLDVHLGEDRGNPLNVTCHGTSRRCFCGCSESSLARAGAEIEQS